MFQARTGRPRRTVCPVMNRPAPPTPPGPRLILPHFGRERRRPMAEQILSEICAQFVKNQLTSRVPLSRMLRWGPNPDRFALVVFRTTTKLSNFS